MLRRLKYDNKTLSNVQGILRFYEAPEENQVSIRRALCAMGEEIFNQVLEFRASRTEDRVELETLSHMLEIERDILGKGECVSLKMMAVTGADLLAMGCPKGRQVGVILNELLEMVLEHPEANEKELLLNTAKKE